MLHKRERRVVWTTRKRRYQRGVTVGEGGCLRADLGKGSSMESDSGFIRVKVIGAATGIVNAKGRRACDQGMPEW